MTPTTLDTTEQQILTHVRHWGSDGYGAFVTKVGRGWHVTACPTVFRTKREAVAQFESYLNTLYDRLAGRV